MEEKIDCFQEKEQLYTKDTDENNIKSHTESPQRWIFGLKRKEAHVCTQRIFI
jgi:hypothetical protein